MKTIIGLLTGLSKKQIVRYIDIPYEGLSCINYVMYSLIVIFTLMLVTPSTYAELDEINNIRHIYKQVNQSIESGDVNIINIYTSDDEYPRNKWHIAKSNTDELFTESPITASIYIQKRKIIKIVFTFVSMVGDWVYTSEHYINDGKVVFIFEETSTFQGYDPNDESLTGPCIVEKRRYYNSQGKEIRYLEKTFDKESKREVKSEYVRSMNFKIYKTVEELPFLELIKAKTDYR